MWQGLNWNPYQNPGGNQCDPTTCAATTFAYTVGDHYACIPCSYGDAFCSAVYPKNSPRFFNSDSCANSTREATADLVCDPCDPIKASAQLIMSIESTPRIGGVSMFNDWWNVREMQDAYSNYFVNDNGWRAITCRYKCAAVKSFYFLFYFVLYIYMIKKKQGFTSNNANPAAYNAEPCVARSSTFASCPGNAAVFFDQASASVSGLALQGDNNYAPIMLRCEACVGVGRIFQATATAVTAPGLCMSLCDPHQRLHTIFTATNAIVTAYMPMQETTCESCDLRPTMPCEGACPLGRYLRGAECVLCNIEPCAAVDFFREPCSGVADSICLPCSPSLLYNTAKSARNEELAIELQNLINITTRRWLPASTSRPACAVVCINNHVWIDVVTGGFAANSSTTKACLPCNSRYVKTHLLRTDRTLYSVWNSANTTADTVPLGGSTEPGGCFFCPAGHDTLDYGSDVMCESMPGYTFSNQGSSGTAEVVPVIPEGAQLAPASPDLGYVRFDFGRRRLLSENAENATRNVRVRQQPLLSSQSNYFKCCTTSTLTHMQKCWSLNLRDLELKKTLTGSSFGVDYCDDSGNAPQPPVTPDIEGCYSGNFKPGRGAGPCYACPNGASTFSDSSSSFSDCRCLQGFRSKRDSFGVLISCTECGAGFYRPPLQLNDTFCLPCPPNTYSPTRSSAYCYCLAGSYMLANGTCALCDRGFYCGADNNRTECPQHSTTLGLGAASRGECLCLSPVYFGDLSVNASSECIYVRPGHNCSLQFSFSLCPCALGWLAQHDGCVSSCSPGSYAMLGQQQSIERCVPCPIDTYADTNQTVHIPMLPPERQCTPCPPNSHTAGTGSVSCACVGVQNGSSCQLCAADQYFEPTARTCSACPTGTKSPASSIGINSCLCPRGSRAMRQMLVSHQTLLCEPCPRGYFSSDLGSSCTPCPLGLSTIAAGSTSRLLCV